MSGCRPASSRARAISARPRVISAGARVVAEAEAVGRAGGDRDDVLERAAALDADDVVGRVDAEASVAEACCTRARASRSLAPATTTAVGWPSGDLLREARAREVREACSCACAASSSSSTSLMSMSVSFSMPLVALHRARPRARSAALRARTRGARARGRRPRRARRRWSASSRSCVARSVAAARRPAGSAGSLLALMASRHVLRCAQRTRRVALVREDLRERGSPRARAENRDLHAGSYHHCAPRRRGAPDAKRLRSRRVGPLRCVVSRAALCRSRSRSELRSDGARDHARRDQRSGEPDLRRAGSSSTRRATSAARCCSASVAIRSRAEDPTMGRFFPASCFAQKLAERSPLRAVQRHGYAWTNLTKRMTLRRERRRRVRAGLPDELARRCTCTSATKRRTRRLHREAHRGAGDARRCGLPDK